MIPGSETKKFIAGHLSGDTAALRLKYAGRMADAALDAALVQIDGRRRFGKKLARTLAAFPDFYFPSLLAGEQSTSDLLAEYHASLIGEGDSVVDLTSGLGIDVLHLAARASRACAVERNPALTEALRYNAEGLGVRNLTVVDADCRDFVRECRERYDVAFIDPARRAADGSRVFSLADCEPDVCAMLSDLRRICRRLIIKASPMLDVSAACVALGLVPAEVVALGTPTECRELDFIVDFDNQSEESLLKAVTIGGGEPFSFTRTGEREAPVPEFSDACGAGDMIFEPYPAVMKLAPFRLLAARYGLKAFGPGTHIYYKESPAAGFPGRAFVVEEVLPYASKVIKRFARRWPVAEVAVRNFGTSAESLRGRLGIRDGRGGVRVYGITAFDSARRLIVCCSEDSTQITSRAMS